jgi:hypothetical protein
MLSNLPRRLSSARTVEHLTFVRVAAASLDTHAQPDQLKKYPARPRSAERDGTNL